MTSYLCWNVHAAAAASGVVMGGGVEGAGSGIAEGGGRGHGEGWREVGRGR